MYGFKATTFTFAMLIMMTLGRQDFTAQTRKGPRQPVQTKSIGKEPALISAFNRQMVSYAQEIIEEEDSTMLGSVLRDEIKNVYSVLKNNEPIVKGDINHDGIADALVPFTVEGRGGGNNWDMHYAVFIGGRKGFHLIGVFDSGGDWADRVTVFKKIKNDVIYAAEDPPNGDPAKASVPSKYILKGRQLVKLKK